jgi:hypothetical protein
MAVGPPRLVIRRCDISAWSRRRSSRGRTCRTRPGCATQALLELFGDIRRHSRWLLNFSMDRARTGLPNKQARDNDDSHDSDHRHHGIHFLLQLASPPPVVHSQIHRAVWRPLRRLSSGSSSWFAVMNGIKARAAWKLPYYITSSKPSPATPPRYFSRIDCSRFADGEACVVPPKESRHKTGTE